ncbi:hypothetical protein ACWA2B_17635 [Paenibacillus sp. CMM36]
MSTQIKLQLIKKKETKSVVSKFLEGGMELETQRLETHTARRQPIFHHAL